VHTDKVDTCHDIQHKKRGRPKIQGQGAVKKPKVHYVKGPIQYTPELVHCSFLTTQSGDSSKSIPLKENQIMSVSTKIGDMSKYKYRLNFPTFFLDCSFYGSTLLKGIR
jgi:hypothetical protein